MPPSETVMVCLDCVTKADIKNAGLKRHQKRITKKLKISVKKSSSPPSLPLLKLPSSKSVPINRKRKSKRAITNIAFSLKEASNQPLFQKSIKRISNKKLTVREKADFLISLPTIKQIPSRRERSGSFSKSSADNGSEKSRISEKDDDSESDSLMDKLLVSKERKFRMDSIFKEDLRELFDSSRRDYNNQEANNSSFLEPSTRISDENSYLIKQKPPPGKSSFMKKSKFGNDSEANMSVFGARNRDKRKTINFIVNSRIQNSMFMEKNVRSVSKKKTLIFLGEK